MKIKTAIIIISSLFLVLVIFLGYVFFVSNAGVEAPEIIKKEPKQNDSQMIEKNEANEIGAEEKNIVPEVSREVIVNNLIKENKKEVERIEDYQEGKAEGVEPETAEDESVKEQEEVDQKVQDIRSLLLK